MITYINKALIFVFAGLFSLSFKPAGDSNDIISEISAAIKSGNAASVSVYFNNTIDLTVPGNEGSFSKSQAELILKDFFSKNPPKSFNIKHQGSSNDGSLFAIGTYVSGNNIYRTYFLIKKISNKFLIQQLEFESE